MNLKSLLRILLINVLLTNAVNLMFWLIWDEQGRPHRSSLIISGLVFFVLQLLINASLLRPYRTVWQKETRLRFGSVAMAVVFALLTWLGVQVWISAATGIAAIAPSSDRIWRYIQLFVLNIFPAALMEEFLFRYLPATYAREKQLYSRPYMLLTISMALLFSLSHVSAYMVRDHLAVYQLTGPLLSAFFYGMAYVLVYSLTGNLYYTAFIHAFSNNMLLWTHTGEQKTFFFYTFFLVALIWYLFRIWWARRLR